MSAKHLTPGMVRRSMHVIDASGVVDLLVPPRQPGQVGRIGNMRQNVRLLLIGMHLAARLGHETTIASVHEVLTQALSKQTQCQLGILRRLTTASNAPSAAYDPQMPAPVISGKRGKRRWDSVEEISYDDLVNAVAMIRRLTDYGPLTAPNLTPEQRNARRNLVDQLIDALIGVSTIPRAGTTAEIDATGQWAWSRGRDEDKPAKPGRRGKGGRNSSPDGPQDGDPGDASAPDEPVLETLDIATDDAGRTAPPEQPPVPVNARGRCLDAAWGYKTSKGGKTELGFGFHQHTIARVPDPGLDVDAEPLLVDGFVLTPANGNVAEASLRLVRRVLRRHKITVLIGDGYYTNLAADNWAVPLANLDVEQCLYMNENCNTATPIRGAFLLHGWMHCPAAPIKDRPLPPIQASDAEWEALHDRVEVFQRTWAFDRKESGLRRDQTTKWMCPAVTGRAGCAARGAQNVQAARMNGLPIITPPDDHTSRDCCTKTAIDFTPNPADPHHQRKLAQREYYGSRRWRRVFKRRGMVEGVFGILKNPSRLRMRRGQNRIAGLAMASLVAAVKVALYNEQQMRAWHARTGRGPADHPLLTPDQPYYGFEHLNEEQARAIVAGHFAPTDTPTVPHLRPVA